MKRVLLTAIILGILSVANLTAGDSKKSELNEKWLLESVDGAKVDAKESAPHIVINTNIKEMIGSDGCNSFSASIAKVNFRRLEVAPGAATMKYCAEQGVEGQMIPLLAQTKRYKLTENVYGDDILQLIGEKGKVLMTFIEANED